MNAPLALPRVRLAQLEDEEEILAMTQRLHAENGLFTLNSAKVRECIKKHYNREGNIVGVIGSPGAIQASTCLALSDFYYTDEWHLAELWNFVDEQYRRLHNAKALIQFGMACADKLKMPLFTGIITNRRMAAKVRLYRQLLGYPTGAFFIYNGNWHSEPMADHSHLRDTLKNSAHKCATNQIKSKREIVALATLLREAAEAIDTHDNLWGSKVKSPSNGVSAAS